MLGGKTESKFARTYVSSLPNVLTNLRSGRPTQKQRKHGQEDVVCNSIAVKLRLVLILLPKKSVKWSVSPVRYRKLSRIKLYFHTIKHGNVFKY